MGRRFAIALVVLGLTARHAAADSWYRGKHGRNRVTHLTVTVGVGAGWLSTILLRSELSALDCRWCEPPSFDRATRNTLVWNNTDRAQLLSNLNAYVAAPLVGLGLLLASDHDAGVSRLIDDLLPIVETVAITQLTVQLLKLSIGRQRPYARFDPPDAPTSDDNVSFPSGHSSLGFAITTSAGVIAHWRHYKTEPYIWGAGIALSLTTEYLRIAADKHYLSDVIVGGLLGVGAGLLVPRLMRRELAIVPVSNGAALVGQF